MSLPLLALSILAGAIAAVSGFGIGSLLTPYLLLTHPPSHAVALVAGPHLWATALRLARLYKAIHWPTFKEFGLASALGGLLGATAQPILGATGLTLALAALLTLAGAAELIQKPLRLPHTKPWRLAEGLSSGAFGGLVGNQGGIRAAALLGFSLPPRALVATATATGVLVDLARIPIYAASAGRAILDNAPTILTASVGLTIGTFIGVPVLGRIPAPLYRRLLGALLVLLAAALAFTA